MKLVHAGNVRIGSEGPAFEGLSVDLKSVYANDLQELIRNCEKQQTDLLLFSGNLFDHRPSEEELKALDEDLSVLTHTRVFIVPGLSDSAGENDAYWTHEWKSRVMVFLGDSLQRVHVPEMNAEITCCGYNENTWPKVRPEKLQRGRKGQFQILLLPFLGENDSKEALETYVSRYASDLKFDYVAVGNAVTKRGEGGIPVYSARSMEQDKAASLDLGADDYITKPFGAIELLAHIRAALRHTRTASENGEAARTGRYHVGELEIDYLKHRVSVSGNEVHLTPNEFKIIALLGRHAGRVMTYKSMLRELWGPSASSDNKILRVHMASIRRKIEPNPNEPRYIFTEVGVGYRMAEADT